MKRFFSTILLMLTRSFLILAFLSALSFVSIAQTGQPLMLNANSFASDSTIELDKADWKYKAGDDLNWVARDLNDADWQSVPDTVIRPDQLEKWNGRAWFRLHFTVDEAIKDKEFAFLIWQTGASEFYIDGKRIAELGAINETKVIEFNPNRLPLPFRFDSAGEHVLAVRFASPVYADPSKGAAHWLTNGGIYPSFLTTLKLSNDVPEMILFYANGASMRLGFLFVGVMLALSMLHFLLYLFYRVERANLFYSVFVFAFAVNLLCGNLRSFGHMGTMPFAILRVMVIVVFAVTFITLMAFLRVAFERNLGKIFWILSGLWVLTVAFNSFYLVNAGNFKILSNVVIFLSFLYSIWLVAKALKDKRRDAWIILTGVQLFALGMLTTLINQLSLIDLPLWVYTIGEIAFILAVPVAVSIFLARGFAYTNRSLAEQLAQVKELSHQKIEQERQAAELRAENDRRAKELEEARNLQLSMLPNKLPKITNLEIAAYMKPATEVGGDYYDFHTHKDGTLTIAVGDATGHGLRAGSVVIATKSLFNAFAEQENIPQIFSQTSRALKKMNLRGLFMAMAMLKIKDGEMTIGIAGMPSVLIYRAESGEIEEISIRALPLGSIANFTYHEQKITLSSDDVVLLMSDGFPEMFNQAGEMIDFERAKEVLTETAKMSPQEIINRFVQVGEKWAGTRAPDDDVTFVVLKIGNGSNLN